MNENVWSQVELFPKDRLREFQLNRLRHLLASAGRIKMYWRKFDECGIDPGRIAAIEEIRKLPLMRKEDLVRAYEDGSFHMEPGRVRRWHRTSGSTGTPVRVPDTQKSWLGYGDLAAAALFGMGIRKEDVVVALFGYGPFIAFWTYIEALNYIGACFVPAGALSTEQRVELIASFGATVLFSTPSYALQLGQTAHEMGIDLSKYLRLSVHAGEPCTPVIKKKLREALGMRPMDRLGTTETGGIAFECSQCSGIYHVQENHIIAEVMDPVTGEPTPPGKIGELIVTPLYRTEVPIIRFKTENLVKVAAIEKCTCGRTLLSLEETENGVVVQRLDNLVKVRGVLINPMAIAEVINAAKEIEEYQITIQSRDNHDEIIIKAELVSGLEILHDSLKSSLEDELKRKVLLRCEIEFVPSLPRSQEKAKRFVDLRKTKS